MTVIETVLATAASDDPYDCAPSMLDRLTHEGPQRFDVLTNAERSPAVARAVLQRLIWTRAVTVNLRQLLTDATLVALPGEQVTL